MKLTQNFHEYEIVVSESRPDLAKRINPSLPQRAFAEVLALKALQPFRYKLGPMKILSWIRSKELNDAVGGSKTSDHLLGTAADFVALARKDDMESVFKEILLLPIDYRQLIFYPEQNFIHVSVNHPQRPIKKESFVFSKGKYLSIKQYEETLNE